LTQLRTEHIGLNQCLHRIKATDSDICPSCGRVKETVKHLLIDCRACEENQEVMKSKLGRRNTSKISYLLMNKKAILTLMRYLDATGRFRDTFEPLLARNSEQMNRE
ncbi:hypothetical protein M422DRAFT_159998, partial [Sphaerobolus stellatus SS14]